MLEIRRHLLFVQNVFEWAAFLHYHCTTSGKEGCLRTVKTRWVVPLLINFDEGLTDP